MKKIVVIILLLISTNAYSQDSMKIKTSLSLQVRDWLYLNSFLKYTPEFDNVYDSMKVKLRVAVSPNMTTVIKVDSVRQGQILRLAQIIREGIYGVVAIPYTRINNALRANAYLIGKIDQMDNNFSSQYSARVQNELDDLRSVLQ